MSTLSEIEAALPSLNAEELAALVQRVTLEMCKVMRAPDHSVLDIAPVSIGRVLRPFSPDDDFLGEMLEGRK